MARQNLVIDVNINPNEQPSATATNIEQSPNPATSNINLRKIAAIGLVANAGRQVAMTTLGQVGTITGNQQTQRTINRIAKLGGIAGAFAINPLAGIISTSVTLGTEAFQVALKVRDENNSATYYNRINGRRVDKGRIK